MASHSPHIYLDHTSNSSLSSLSQAQSHQQQQQHADMGTNLSSRAHTPSSSSSSRSSLSSLTHIQNPHALRLSASAPGTEVVAIGIGGNRLSDVNLGGNSGNGSVGGSNSREIIPDGGRGEEPLEAWVLNQLCSFTCCAACVGSDESSSAVVANAHSAPPPTILKSSTQTQAQERTLQAPRHSQMVSNPMMVVK